MERWYCGIDEGHGTVQRDTTVSREFQLSGIGASYNFTIEESPPLIGSDIPSRNLVGRMRRTSNRMIGPLRPVDERPSTGGGA